MKTPISISTISLLFFFLNVIICSCFSPSQSQGHNDFLQCLNNSGISGLVYTRTNSSYLPLLNSTSENLRFTSPSTPKPFVIVTPVQESQIPAIVLCSKAHGIQIRIRSGGHDFEGLSYTSPTPFVIVDLFNLNKITINVTQKTAWVEPGVTLGQFYYEISQASRTLGFPGGECPTVGLGGYLSGGGYGPLVRKYGLAADQIVDARLIDVNGKILNKKSMGEDLFWAIRSGGGNTFGIVTAWKVKLVPVPEILTLFQLNRSLEQNAEKLVENWQYVAPKLPKDAYFTVLLQKDDSRGPDNKTIQTTFVCMFLGRANKLVDLFEQKFPELGLKREDCVEVSWIQTVLAFASFPLNASPQLLTSRVSQLLSYAKGKSDFVQEPIPTSGLQGIWKLLLQDGTGRMLLIPFGGKMSEIPESALPFPHRKGNLYLIQYIITWNDARLGTARRKIDWMRRLYRYMATYASKSPRRAYINYRDLDLGVNKDGNTSYAQASIWGLKYFKSNFKRLVQVKTMADPSNFLRNEQSIPPLHS